MMTDEDTRSGRGSNPLQHAGEIESGQRHTERRRPAWVAAALVWASLGVYFVFWVGINWAEMKRELRSDRMYPIWHALAMAVPIYSLFRLHANFRVINELLQQTRTEHRVKPLYVIITFILASALFSVPVQSIQITMLNLLATMGAFSWVVYHGQAGMNAYWDTKPERKLSTKIELWERLLIAFGAGFWFLLITGLIAGTGTGEL